MGEPLFEVSFVCRIFRIDLLPCALLSIRDPAACKFGKVGCWVPGLGVKGLGWSSTQRIGLMSCFFGVFTSSLSAKLTPRVPYYASPPRLEVSLCLCAHLSLPLCMCLTCIHSPIGTNLPSSPMPAVLCTVWVRNMSRDARNATLRAVYPRLLHLALARMRDIQHKVLADSWIL
jgi:hypothetical protein